MLVCSSKCIFCDSRASCKLLWDAMSICREDVSPYELSVMSVSPTCTLTLRLVLWSLVRICVSNKRFDSFFAIYFPDKTSSLLGRLSRFVKTIGLFLYYCILPFLIINKSLISQFFGLSFYIAIFIFFIENLFRIICHFLVEKGEFYVVIDGLWFMIIGYNFFLSFNLLFISYGNLISRVLAPSPSTFKRLFVLCLFSAKLESWLILLFFNKFLLLLVTMLTRFAWFYYDKDSPLDVLTALRCFG